MAYYFVTRPERMEVILEDCYILINEKKKVEGASRSTATFLMTPTRRRSRRRRLFRRRPADTRTPTILAPQPRDLPGANVAVEAEAVCILDQR
jgi:hypothetical protein